jgi:hypothetical protein
VDQPALHLEGRAHPHSPGWAEHPYCVKRHVPVPGSHASSRRAGSTLDPQCMTCRRFLIQSPSLLNASSKSRTVRYPYNALPQGSIQRTATHTYRTPLAPNECFSRLALTPSLKSPTRAAKRLHLPTFLCHLRERSFLPRNGARGRCCCCIKQAASRSERLCGKSRPYDARQIIASSHHSQRVDTLLPTRPAKTGYFPLLPLFMSKSGIQLLYPYGQRTSTALTPYMSLHTPPRSIRTKRLKHRRGMEYPSSSQISRPAAPSAPS